MKAVAGGQTYSEVTAAWRADPTNTAPAGQVQTLFRGQTVRGLLLYAWGWSVVAMIAGWFAIATFVGAAVVLVALGYSFMRPPLS